VNGVQTQPPGPTEAAQERPSRRRASPWWGLVPVAMPWLWFAVRNADGLADLVAIALPAIGAVAVVAALLMLGLRHLVLAATAASIALVSVVAIVGPRLPQRTEPPAQPIKIVSDNVFRAGHKPWLPANAMIAQNADMIVSVEMGPLYWATLGRHAAESHPYAVVDGQQGIRSRWPIEPLSTPDGLPADRVLRASVNADGMPVTVYAVHLYNPLHETTFSEQEAMLERLIAAVDAEPDPTIVVGDFNMSDRSAGYRTIDATMRDAMRTGWWTASTYLGTFWRGLMLRIDHLFVPEDWCTADAYTFSVPGSDHRGIGSTVGPCS
jgi:endonuclease/exonuclease/phosphatase (EEP) superfamily protein YafD